MLRKLFIVLTGLYIFCTTNTFADYLKQVASYKTDDAQAITVVGNHAFIANGHAGIKIIKFDLSLNTKKEIQESIQEVASFGTGGYATAITAVGNHAFIVTGFDIKIIKFDLSLNPKEEIQASIQEVASFKTEWFAQAITVVGNHAFIANGHAGIKIIKFDLSLNTKEEIQESVQEVASLKTGKYAQAITVVGNHAFIADGCRGIKVIKFDLNLNPKEEIQESIQEVASFETGGSAVAITVVGKHAFIANFDGGIKIFKFDLSLNSKKEIQASIQEVASFEIEGFAQAVTVVGNHALTANGREGIKIFEISESSKLAKRYVELHKQQMPMIGMVNTHSGEFYKHKRNIGGLEPNLSQILKTIFCAMECGDYKNKLVKQSGGNTKNIITADPVHDTTDLEASLIGIRDTLKQEQQFVIPIRANGDRQDCHWVGLVISRDKSGAVQIKYIDPMGLGMPSAVEQVVRSVFGSKQQIVSLVSVEERKQSYIKDQAKNPENYSIFSAYAVGEIAYSDSLCTIHTTYQ